MTKALHACEHPPTANSRLTAERVLPGVFLATDKFAKEQFDGR